MVDDFLDDFMGYDFAMGADETKCPHCGREVSLSLFMGEDESDCPSCGKTFKR
jgi:uncharacterized Zn-finger protein